MFGFNLQLVQLIGRFSVLFPSHTDPGVQLWFHLHLYTWVVHRSLLPRLPWRTGFCSIKASSESPVLAQCAFTQMPSIVIKIPAGQSTNAWWGMFRKFHFCVWLGFALQFSSVAQSCPTLCNPMDCSTPGFPVHHQLQELAQTHVPQVGDTIQPPHPLLCF